jgi:hypothetical protein
MYVVSYAPFMRRLATTAVTISVTFSFCVTLGASLPASGAEANGPAPVVLLDAGASPRETIRLAPTPGVQTTHTMLLSTTVEQSGAVSMKSGPLDMRATVTTTTGTPDADGNTTMQVTYGKMEVLDSSKGASSVLRAMRRSLAAFTGVTGETTISPTGATVRTKFDVPADADPTAASLIDQISKQADQLSVPFPEEAVGVGARWRATTTLQVSGIHLTQTYTYTLRAREGTHLELSVTATQKAPKGLVHLPAMPRGVKVRFIKYRNRLSGTSVHELTDAFAVESTIEGGGTQVFTVGEGSDLQEVVQKVHLECTVSTPEPTA